MNKKTTIHVDRVASQGIKARIEFPFAHYVFHQADLEQIPWCLAASVAWTGVEISSYSRLPFERNGCHGAGHLCSRHESPWQLSLVYTCSHTCHSTLGLSRLLTFDLNIDLVIWCGTQHSCTSNCRRELTSVPSHMQPCVFKPLFIFFVIETKPTDRGWLR